MLGWFKKGRAAESIDNGSALLPERFWDEMGLGHLVPVYLQLHLAARSPENQLARNPDGSFNTDEVPAFIHADDPRARRQFLQLMSEQLAPGALPALSPDEIVNRLCAIYTTVTGKDMYATVCKAWCVQKKLV